MISSSSGSSKRIRVLDGARQNVSCLVDGCNSDLSKCRDYYRRHKVCERHSKTQIVIIAGEEKRFCQQCSKFHSLGEFDGGKRSCRKRLDGHNRRRRKQQLESWSCGSNLQGTRFLQFNIPRADAATRVRSRNWPMISSGNAEKVTNDPSQELHISDQQNHQISNTFTWTFSGGNNQLRLLQANDPEIAFCNPLQDSIVSSESGRSSHESQSVNSDWALYLLSTHPTQTQACGNRLSHLLHSNVTEVLPPGSGLQANTAPQSSPSYGVTRELVHSVMVPDAQETKVEYNGTFNAMANGLLRASFSSALPLSWD